MSNPSDPPEIPLPKSWKETVKSAVLHVVSLAHMSMVAVRGQAAEEPNRVAYLNSVIERLEHDLRVRDDKDRIKDARMKRIPAQRRPHYTPIERLEILELRATCGWSLKQTAEEFLVAPSTISSWMNRADEQGPDALLQLREPVNKFPEFVWYVVQRMKTPCPTLGKKKLAKTLCRAALHLGQTTVGRILKEKPAPNDDDSENGTGLDQDDRCLSQFSACQSQASHRTTQTLAARLAVRQTTNARRRTTRRSLHNQGRFPRRPSSFATCEYRQLQHRDS